MRVVVTGGRGMLGRHVVELLRRSGHEALAAGRHGPLVMDVRKDADVEAALEGVDAVVHCASNPLGRDAREVEVEGTARVVAAAHRQGVGHLLYVSIVGIDRVPRPYFRYKLHAEKVVEHGRVPWTILRATQLFPFMEMLLTAAPVVIAPRGFLVQPVAGEEVAQRLARALGEGPMERRLEYGGPEVREVGELARTLRATRRLRRPLLKPWLPGQLAAAVRAGGLLCRDCGRGAITWEEWLQRAPARQ
ncbi:MAG: NAD(P)H-binding protein [Candidatus Dormibacteraeota bacterium]|nr:NAD(P)H-binding protein [Candidatus Dormibacteraeota bacterium]